MCCFKLQHFCCFNLSVQKSLSRSLRQKYILCFFSFILLLFISISVAVVICLFQWYMCLCSVDLSKYFCSIWRPIWFEIVTWALHIILPNFFFIIRIHIDTEHIFYACVLYFIYNFYFFLFVLVLKNMLCSVCIVHTYFKRNNAFCWEIEKCLEMASSQIYQLIQYKIYIWNLQSLSTYFQSH